MGYDARRRSRRLRPLDADEHGHRCAALAAVGAEPGNAGAAKIATERFERRLAGVWDTAFHIGRTVRDDLFAAQLQAEWCGDTELRSHVRKLLATDILSDDTASTSDVRWGLQLWASEPSSKRVTAAVRASEPHLDAAAAAELFLAVRDDSQMTDDVAIDVAAGVWDLLSDADADSLLIWLPSAEVQRREQARDNLLGALLWRRPHTWAQVFADASQARRAGMFAAVEPAHLGEMHDELRLALADHAPTDARAFSAASAALRVATGGKPLPPTHELKVPDLVDLLDWSAESVAPEVIAAETDRLVQVVLRRQSGAAERGSIGLGAYDVGQFLGRLASYLPYRHAPVVDALSATVTDPASPADWQFGALEGLAALGRADRLDVADREAVGILQVVPGQRVLGELISAETLRAAQLRVVGPAMSADDVSWLAVIGRGSDVQARLVSMAALGVEDLPAAAAVDWSLIGGLFDPDDAVTIQAVASLGRRGVEPESGASDVVRDRLAELFARGRRDVRREVVVTAAARPELDGADIVTRAHEDRSWMVRREARAAP